MWLERISLLSLFLLLTVQTVCLNLDKPPEDRHSWFYVFSPLWCLLVILFILLCRAWGECCCVAFSRPVRPGMTPGEIALAERRRARKPSDAADLIASTLSWAFFVTLSILLAVYWDTGDAHVAAALVIVFLVFQVALIAYLLIVSYYNTLRKETGRDRLSYASCLAIAFRRKDPDDARTLTDEPNTDLSVCGDAGFGRCKCTAGYCSDELTWIDAIQSFFIYVLLIALFITSILLHVRVTRGAPLVGVILVPLYVAISALLVNSFCLVCQLANRSEGGYGWTTYLLYVASLGLTLTFLVLLAMKIDADSIRSWFYVFLPLSIALFGATVGTCTLLCCPLCREAKDESWGVLAREPARTVSEVELETDTLDFNL